MQKISVFRAAMALVLTMVPVCPVQAQFWQCVAYAREATGVAIRGDAKTWWGQAAGVYERGATPAPGAVMAFASIPGMPYGHVAVVAKVISPREILLDHANWSRRGAIERGVRAVDVSTAGDWSAVRVHYAPIGGLGTRVNRVTGFIYPTIEVADNALGRSGLGAGGTQLAMLKR